jgi:hypothetical protein
VGDLFAIQASLLGFGLKLASETALFTSVHLITSKQFEKYVDLILASLMETLLTFVAVTICWNLKDKARPSNSSSNRSPKSLYDGGLTQKRKLFERKRS